MAEQKHRLSEADQAFLRELSAMTVVPETEATEPDELAGLRVTVRRHWNDQTTLYVPVDDLRDFHWRRQSGGVGKRSPRPMLHARMWCSSIPEGSDFPHSCLHGPPPHEILVCICRCDNKEVFDRLTAKGRKPAAD